MSVVTRLIPSMFARRLGLLALVTALVLLGLGWQLTRLTVVQGARWQKKAARFTKW